MIHKLSRLGIGDIFLFCLEIKSQRYSKIKINIDKNIILQYRKDTPNYLDFCMSIIKKFLYDVEIEFLDDNFSKSYSENWYIIQQSIQSEDVIKFYSDLFKKKMKAIIMYYLLKFEILI